ncbi:MAG: alpha-amylase family glycosyl hydrolase [Planctomycetota bacterium]|jgi:glycosidase
MMSRTLIAFSVSLLVAAPGLPATNGQQGKVTPAPKASVPKGEVKPTPGDASAKTEPARQMRVPAWTRDARWHQIVVSKFRNGESANDPPGCLPWTAKLPVSGQSPERKRREGKPRGLEAREYGGDLQGLQLKLSYLRKLGINTLYLTSIFQPAGGDRKDAVDMRHIDDSLAVAKSVSELTGESGDPKTWKFSASDRVFLGLLKEAHKLGHRVVVEGRFADLAAPSGSSKDLESHVFAVTTRWMDPNDDGDPSDGIDGWVVSAAGDFWKHTGRMWRIHAKRTSPNAVVVGDLRESPLGAAAAADFDLVIGYDLGEGVRRFFSGAGGTHPLRQFVDELGQKRGRYGPVGPGMSGRVILPLSGPRMGRMLSAISSGRPKPNEADLDRWRLAAVFHHFYAAAPMTFYGDEVGMPGEGGSNVLTPMWWHDLPDPAAKSPDYRGDFLALVRMFNALRDQYAALRHGEFHPVLLDEGRRIFAFRRALPGEEAIVVMNYGDTNYQVELPAHHAGQLVRVIDPQLKPMPSRLRGRPAPAKIDYTKTARLRVGGTRQFANDLGKMSLWMAPMSVRIALLNDEE